MLSQWHFIYPVLFTVAGAALDLSGVFLLSHRLPDYPFVRKTKGHPYYRQHLNTDKTCLSKVYYSLCFGFNADVNHKPFVVSIFGVLFSNRDINNLILENLVSK
jgi:hypothetical protein